MDLTCLLSFEANLEPLIDAVSDAKSGQLDSGLADNIIIDNIRFHDLDGQIVSNGLDIDLEGLVPNWGLASAVLGVGLELLLTSRELAVRVQLTECLRVACQSSLNDSQG